MPTIVADRAEAVKAALLANRNEIAALASMGRPCAECANLTSRDGSLAPHCGHLALTRPSYDPVTGAVTQTIEVPAEDARAPDGLCGPEGLLFEPLRHAVIRRHVKNLDLYAGIFALWLISGLFFWAVLWPMLVG